jgi:tRNA(Arg) A34 adenosine deaminase TadA
MCLIAKDRRAFVSAAVALVLAARVAQPSATTLHPDLRWFHVAEEMKRQAESWGDQSYGAVLVFEGQVVGFGPSRVVKDKDPDAHAERVAIRDAQRRLGRSSLSGAVLYSTSRPCGLCEAAAANARIARMYFGRSLQDAGAPRGQ